MDALTVINEKLANYRGESESLLRSARTIANTSAHSIVEREAQMRTLHDYDRRINELAIKISCAEELASAILAMQVVSSSEETPAA